MYLPQMGLNTELVRFPLLSMLATSLLISFRKPSFCSIPHLQGYKYDGVRGGYALFFLFSCLQFFTTNFYKGPRTALECCMLCHGVKARKQRGAGLGAFFPFTSSLFHAPAFSTIKKKNLYPTYHLLSIRVLLAAMRGHLRCQHTGIFQHIFCRKCHASVAEVCLPFSCYSNASIPLPHLRLTIAM